MQFRYCGVACVMTALKDRGCVWSGGHVFAETQPAQLALKQMAAGLLMGRKLVNVASELAFFSFGLTSACFQVSGNFQFVQRG